jgi:hypothetical protein
MAIAQRMAQRTHTCVNVRPPRIQFLDRLSLCQQRSQKIWFDDYDDERGNALSSPAPGFRVLVGRTPTSLPKNINFCRPVSPGGTSKEVKRQVLARNSFCSTSTHSNLRPSPQPAPQSSPVPHLFPPIRGKAPCIPRHLRTVMAPPSPLHLTCALSVPTI